MIDRLFTAILTFVLLAGGTFSIASAWFGHDQPARPDVQLSLAKQALPVQLPRVVVTGTRVGPAPVLARDEVLTVATLAQ